MSVKIRLQRHGKKGKPFYWIVAADSRVKRDGRLLEKLGTYNPNTDPATIDLNVDDTVKWLQNGAQPTDTARAILSYKGAMLKNHLAGGVHKGALTEEQAEAKFNAWIDEKDGKINAKSDGLAKEDADAKAKALAAEKEVNEARKAIVVEAPAEEVAAETPTEEVAAEAPPEEVAAEAPAKEVAAEAPTKEVVAEAPAKEVVTEAPAKKVAAEAPAKEVVAEEVAAVEETVEATKDAEVSNEEE